MDQLAALKRVNVGQTASLQTSNPSTYSQRGLRLQRYEARGEDHPACNLRAQRQRNPNASWGHQVARFERKQRAADDPSELMRRAIDSHHKRMSRFTLRNRAKVSTQQQNYCLVHIFERSAATRRQRERSQRRATSSRRKTRIDGL